MATSARWSETRLRKTLAALLVRAALVVFMISWGGACREEGPAERAGEQIDEALEEAGEKVDEVVDEAKEKVDDEE
jgi:hypothetical protein